nr:unnamed protein product [Digitaria exilis]
MFTAGATAYRALLVSLTSPTVTCVIADRIMPFAVDIAEELGVPAIAFRTASACSYLAYLSFTNPIELGEFPFPSDDAVVGVAGMESFLRRRDLPRAIDPCVDGVLDPLLVTHAEGISHERAARAVILNTAASMEGPAISRIAPRVRDVFAIGPLHATSLAVMSHEEFTEFMSGLIAAGYPFLWVLRRDMVETPPTSSALSEAVEAAAEGDRARIVEWAPQQAVLRHRAVGCFLTHAGWNSTVEAAVEGVPMVCWPFFADQLINSRFVGAVWRTGVDMKDVPARLGIGLKPWRGS